MYLNRDSIRTLKRLMAAGLVRHVGQGKMARCKRECYTERVFVCKVATTLEEQTTTGLDIRLLGEISRGIGCHQVATGLPLLSAFYQNGNSVATCGNLVAGYKAAGFSYYVDLQQFISLEPAKVATLTTTYSDKVCSLKKRRWSPHIGETTFPII